MRTTPDIVEEDEGLLEVMVRLSSWGLGDAGIVLTLPATRKVRSALEALKSPAVDVVRLSGAG